MFLLATVRRPRGVDVAVKVRNLSPGGMMAECPSGFVRGEVVEVDLRGIGTVAGRIAWTASGRIGVQFDEVIDHLRTRMPVVPGPRQTFISVQRNTWRPGVRGTP